MTATPGYVGVGGGEDGPRSAPYPAPLFAVYNQTVPPTTEISLDAPYRCVGDAFLWAWCDSLLGADRGCRAALLAVDPTIRPSGYWVIDEWRDDAPPYQGPRTTLLPPSAIRLFLNNATPNPHRFFFSLVPRYRWKDGEAIIEGGGG